MERARWRRGAAAAALAAAACGPDDPAASAPQGGRETVVFQHFQVPGGSAPLDALLARFEEESGIQVVDRVLPSSSDEQHRFYVTELEAGASDFDVLAIDVVWVAEFARAGWLLDLGDVLAPEEREDLLDAPLEACTWDGRLYAVPWFVDGGLLYHRTDLLERHDLEPPETMEELVRTAETVLEREGDPRLLGFVWQGRQYEGLVCVALEFLAANGAAILREGGVALGEPRALEALRALRGFVERGVSPELVTTLDEEGARLLFQSGRAVYMRNWPYAWRLLQAEGSPVRGVVGYGPMPRFDREDGTGRHAATLGGWQLGVNRASRRPEAAKALVRFLASPEAQRALALEVGFEPARRSVYGDERVQSEAPFLASLLSVLEDAVPRPVTPWYPMIAQILQAELSAVVSGLRDPEDAAARAEVQIGHVLAMEEEG